MFDFSQLEVSSDESAKVTIPAFLQSPGPRLVGVMLDGCDSSISHREKCIRRKIQQNTFEFLIEKMFKNKLRQSNSDFRTKYQVILLLFKPF